MRLAGIEGGLGDDAIFKKFTTDAAVLAESRVALALPFCSVSTRCVAFLSGLLILKPSQILLWLAHDRSFI